MVNFNGLQHNLEEINECLNVNMESGVGEK
jgi:hypothetical protein